MPVSESALGEVSEQVPVDFPFELELQHAPLDVRQMFELSAFLDFHELRRREGGDNFQLIIDLLDLQAERTTVQAKPRQAMTYDEIADHVELLLAEFQSRLGSARVTRLRWLVDRKGVASDMRASHQRVH